MKLLITITEPNLRGHMRNEIIRYKCGVQDVAK